ncbi:chemotaxis protein CheW [Massilia cavernae]|uniref:CheW-like domain-containing protein n=1 Tax=Massilia cavernae TaxID=2320864 RepID=A0A418Y6C4_9BURK|nr:chemotaxis protein CheW [Massilia cavernae]RJG23427.1 hypothetical protein D3872_04490 [Massilia cavernae]
MIDSVSAPDMACGDMAGAAPPSPCAAPKQFIEFECAGRRFAVPLSGVRRVVMAVEPATLAGASAIVPGVLNVAGDTVTVLDFAVRVGCGPTVISLAHYIVIADCRACSWSWWSTAYSELAIAPPGAGGHAGAPGGATPASTRSRRARWLVVRRPFRIGNPAHAETAQALVRTVKTMAEVRVVQHLASGFTAGLAAWLSSGGYPVRMAADGERLEGGRTCWRRTASSYRSGAPEHGMCPSVSYLLRAVHPDLRGAARRWQCC